MPSCSYEPNFEITMNQQSLPERGIRVDTVQDRSIQAVVSLLDDDTSKRVSNIWAELESEFGLQKIYAAPFPHFSYHVSERYDDDIEERLARIAANTAPYSVRISGLGVFAAPRPIIYLSLVRSTLLSQCHQALWSDLSEHAYSTNLHYHPEAWVPHITLAQGDLTKEQMPDVLRYLSQMTFDWVIEVNNLALVFAEGLEQGIKREFPLGQAQSDAQGDVQSKVQSVATEVPPAADEAKTMTQDIDDPKNDKDIPDKSTPDKSTSDKGTP